MISLVEVSELITQSSDKVYGKRIKEPTMPKKVTKKHATTNPALPKSKRSDTTSTKRTPAVKKKSATQTAQRGTDKKADATSPTTTSHPRNTKSSIKHPIDTATRSTKPTNTTTTTHVTPTPPSKTISKSTKKSSRKSKPPSLSEITGGGQEDVNALDKLLDKKTPTVEQLDISDPVPRTGPPISSALERMLTIKWSKYIPHTPTKKQLAAMMLADIKEVMFGGALGGGKSDWLAMEALRYCDLPGFSSIIFRRQLTDLKQPGALIPRIAEWLSEFQLQGCCRYSGDEHAWNFKTVYPHTDIPGPDARLQFGYIGEASIRDRYSSAEYQMVGFEELWQWPSDVDYTFMRSRIRKVVCAIHGKHNDGTPNYVPGCRYCDTLSAIPLRVRSATNPGPAWIKRRFGIIPDPAQFPTRHEALVAISEGHKIRWIGTNKERPFIPSYLDDNPFLDGKDYREMLKEMSDEERSRLEDGNWEARRNARFKRRWQRFYHLNAPQELLNAVPYEINFASEDISYDLDACSFSFVSRDRSGNDVVHDPIPLRSLMQIFITVDPAVTVRKGPVDEQVRQKNSSAVISTWGVTGDQNLLWLNCRKFKKEIPDLVEHVVNVNNIWKPRYTKVECNGVGIGVAQYLEAAGIQVTKNYRKTDKLENSLSAQILMKNGRIWFPANATWLEEIEDDVFGWTGLPSEDDDVIDTLADAATEIATGIAHEISAPSITRGRPRAVSSVNTSTMVPSYGLQRYR